jgi:signal transduction histidine kinase
VGKTSSDYARSVVNTVREPLVVLDNKFRVISANRAFYTTFKVTPETSENTLLYDLGDGQWDIPRLRELLEKVLPKSTTIEDFEVEHDFPDIGQKTMLMNARRIQGETGATQMILLAIEDITERRLVEAELHTYREHLEALVDEQTAELKGALADLERSNAELQQFAYVASHDLQEPLRMVASYLQLLEKRYKGMLDDDADDFIHYAVDGALRMQRLIHDLLELSRIATREQEVVSTDATVALDAARANLEFLIEECGGTVTNDTLPTISANEVQFAQLMQNLVANALKFRGEEPPRVHVSAKQESNEWVFSVRDNGIGFEPEQAERIFTIFQRLNPKSAPQGTGIGLAISKSIVEKYGGRIWTESVPGEGSTFYFTVPLDRGGAA